MMPASHLPILLSLSTLLLSPLLTGSLALFPGQPTNFQVGEVSDTSVELTWEPAFEKEGIISYELHYREGRQESQVKKTFGPTSSYVVEGLRANTEYFFSLAAVSNKGIGAFTNEISQRTSQASM
ncbi:receptor-type tyrosine-protein phosphatase S-like [Sinocyclocheilus grahami]|uniref:receptor-type tyrosine-protein phosphatase S-like n=1 Tax=Sinocyclocheilus grahami TaxID=75366 RepID=UPI0007ACC841|nr:PREDICTED: receptor-type tyrosine-protein phosphatase S-like [Sinocyclocheilus grahami]